MPNFIIHNALQPFPLEKESVNLVVTSPPYWRLRNYDNHPDQIGAESTVAGYVEHMVQVGRNIRDVLAKDGSYYLNIGDSYNDRKCLDLVPHRTAIGMIDDGWILRNTIVWCLSQGTRLYAKTQKGEMPTPIKDLVRLNPSTVKLWNGKKWTQVLGWTNTGRKKGIKLILRSGEQIVCTDSHVWPTNRGELRTDELIIGDVIDSCKLPEPQEPDVFDYLPDSIGWFIGLYLAEGSLGSRGDCIQISGNSDEEEYRMNRISDLVKKYGGTVKSYINKKSNEIHIFSSLLLAVLSMYITGNTAHHKHLSMRCWQRRDIFLKELLGGYLDGDGCYDDDNERWRLSFCRNLKLANDLRTLTARLGFVLTLNPTVTTNTKTGKKHKSFYGTLKLNRSNHFNCKERNEVVEIQPSETTTFYEIGVEDEPHLFALASGVLTHNCKPNAMPCSIKDRLNTTHEYVFHFVKNKKYYYNLDAIRVPHQTLKAKDIVDKDLLFRKLGIDTNLMTQDDIQALCDELAAPKLETPEDKGYENTKLDGQERINIGARGGFADNGETQENRYADGGKNPGDVFEERKFTREDELRAEKDFGYTRHAAARVTARLRMGLAKNHPLGKNPGDVHTNYKQGEDTERSNNVWWLDGFSTECPSCGSQFETAVTDFYNENPEDVWHINTIPFPDTHYAVFPPTLIENMIKAASRPGDVVLDPFSGSGTTAITAEALNRKGVGFDLSYQEVRERRVQKRIQTALEL